MGKLMLIISSHVTDYLSSIVEHNSEIETIVLWSDGCTAQNKCNNLSSAKLMFTVQNNITILHKYLEVDHTQMECDAVHSTVERATKKSETICQWIILVL